MKDYGNAGALCGALGCMVLLIISMQFANKKEEPKVENVSAEISTEATEETAAKTTASSDDVQQTSPNETETDVTGDVTGEQITTTTTTAAGNVFVGPLDKETMVTMQGAVKNDIDPELLHQIYPEQLCIVGDSIASGFGAYSVLTNPYNFAVGNLASWSIQDYTFTYDEMTYGYLEALEAAQPAYIYLSMGMNDVNMITSDEYATNYKNIITSIMDVCPDSSIVAAGISPVAYTSSFTANSTIEMFNEMLKSTVEEFGSPRVRYYDTMPLLVDEATGGLRVDCDGGDGVHLSGAAYYTLLENVYPILDEMPAAPIVQRRAEELAAEVPAEGEMTPEEEADTTEQLAEGE